LIQVLRQNLQQFQAKLRLAKELGNLSQKVSDLESKVQILERLVAKRDPAPRPLARQFGQLAIAEGLLTPEQVALVLKKQQALDGEGHQDRVSPTPQGGA